MHHRQPDLDYIFNMANKYKKQILIIFFICFLFSCLVSHFVTQKYVAHMVVSPAVHDIKLKDKQAEDGSVITSDFDKFLYLLSSNQVAQKLSADKTISKKISPSFSPMSILLYGKLYSGSEAEAIQGNINKNLDIEDIKDTGMKRISFRHKNQNFAKYLLNKAYKQSDQLIKDKELEKNQKQVEFLRNSLAIETLSENRQTFSSILAHQLQIQSMLKVDLPYSADIVEDITVSSRPVSPSIIMIVFSITILLGGLLSALFIYKEEAKHGNSR